jgi:hypothetical protein
MKSCKITKLIIVVVSFIVFLLGTKSVFSQGNNNKYYKSFSQSQSLIIENTNLTAKRYLNALMDGTTEERKYSEMYLLGVLDSSEGEIWCDYKTYKTITIDEILFVEMKKLSELELNKRASLVIKDILKNQFPCGSKK